MQCSRAPRRPLKARSKLQSPTSEAPHLTSIEESSLNQDTLASRSTDHSHEAAEYSCNTRISRSWSRTFYDHERSSRAAGNLQRRRSKLQGFTPGSCQRRRSQMKFKVHQPESPPLTHRPSSQQTCRRRPSTAYGYRHLPPLRPLLEQCADHRIAFDVTTRRKADILA